MRKQICFSLQAKRCNNDICPAQPGLHTCTLFLCFRFLHPATKTDAEQQLVLEQWDLLCQMEMVGEEGAFVIGWEKVLTEEELFTALKVSALEDCFVWWSCIQLEGWHLTLLLPAGRLI